MDAWYRCGVGRAASLCLALKSAFWKGRVEDLENATRCRRASETGVEALPEEAQRQIEFRRQEQQEERLSELDLRIQQT